MYIIFSLKSKFGRDIFLDDLDCNYSTIVENCNLELDGIGILKNSIFMLTANALSVTYTSGKGTFRKPLSISCLPCLGNFLKNYFPTCLQLINIKGTFYVNLNSRCLMVSTNQVDPSCFYFRISWILMERRWFYFFVPSIYCRASEVTT